MKTVVGLFDTHAHAEAAAHDLEKAGISHDDISLIANNTSGQFSTPEPTPAGSPDLADAESETGKGAIAGGVAGLLLSLAALAIPGLGVIAAAGWLATMVTGALVGAGVGLVGALNGVGLSHEEAAYYTEGVRRGGTLLAARVPDDQADDIAQLLSSDGAVDINERAEQYRREGFVPGAAQADSTPSAVAMNTSAADTPAVSVNSPADAALPAVPPAAAEETVPPAVPIGATSESVPSAASRLAAPNKVSGAAPIPAQAAAPAVPSKPAGQTAEESDLSRTERDLTPGIRVRAYYLYVERGRGDGLALQDWLTAEREIQYDYASSDGASSV